MKRVLYVITELDPGGAEKALYHLVARLDSSRFQAEVACLSGQGQVGEWLERREVPVHYLRGRAAAWPLALARLTRLARRGRFDIVHTFLFHANLLGRMAARLAGVPRVVCSVRVEEPRRSHQLLNRLTRRLADRFVCVSRSTAEFFQRHCAAAPDRIVVIPNGVDASEFAPPQDPPAAAGRRLRVVSVGRLDRQKGYDTLVDAARLCAARGLEFETIVAGEGPERAALERRIADAGLAGAFRLIGRCDDVPALLRSADLFVSSSRWEGMPNAVLEAMATGLPVVAAAVGGSPELVEPDECGLLVPPDDPAALADAMADLLLGPARRVRFGQRGRERVLAYFTWERNADAHMALYDSL